MGYDLNQAPRLKDGWTAILNALADGEWHPFDELHQASGLAQRTVENLLRRGSATNEITRRGKPLSKCRVRLKHPLTTEDRR